MIVIFLLYTCQHQKRKIYAMDLLYAYDGWEDYEQIDKDLYDILKIFQIKNRDYSHRKEIISKLNK